MSRMMYETPDESKPREKLLLFGENNLSNQELLAIILRSGTKNISVLDVANDLLLRFGNLYNVEMATVEELQQIQGIGKIKAVELKAVFELGKRLVTLSQEKFGKVYSSEFAGKYLINEIGKLKQENVMVLYLNTKNEIIKKKIIYIGSINRTVAEPHDIFREGIKIGSNKLIVGHNHPSGNPQPSQEDILFTKRLVESGLLLGIEVLDHIIVGDTSYLSLKEKQYI